jgi:hypothetical protein
LNTKALGAQLAVKVLQAVPHVVFVSKVPLPLKLALTAVCNAALENMLLKEVPLRARIVLQVLS